MAKAALENEACEHLVAPTHAAWPFVIEMTLDGQSGPTDAIVRCRTCGQAYLIEMLNWSGAHFERRTFRTSLLDDVVVARYSHNRNSTSCDLKRAAAEWYAVQTQARLTSLEITLDVDASTLIGARLLPPDTDIPMAHWRDRLGAR